jgi:hypothetical protein
MNINEQKRLISLILDNRWAALATIQENIPMASMVAYVMEPEFDGLLLHLSQLASHTRNLMTSKTAALVISEQDKEEGDPQTLARISMQGKVTALDKEGDDYQTAMELYLSHLPDAEQRFGFSDFFLFRFTPDSIRYVGGFANAHKISLEQLRNAAKIKSRP